MVRFSERLVIELNCPQISLDWANPGDLEQLLIEFLRDRIGVGRYPNDAREITDVAARLVLRANQARARRETLTPHELLHDLGLRSDFGQLPQKFPVPDAEFVDRPEFSDLKNAIEAGRRRIALCGPPGSGKSWLLTKCQAPLSDAGMIVVRHYCYVEPHDRFRAERVTTKVLYGNLTASLFEQLPSLRDNPDTKYGASRRDFEHLLRIASSENPDRKLVMIVDGLDHVARILANEPKLSPAQAAIVHELATLPLPDNVCLVVGSQPIMALTGLSIDSRLEMRKWTIRDGLELLKRRHYLNRFFRGTMLSSASFLKVLLDKSEGNPLYLRYLTMQLKDYAADEGLFKILSQVPVINGDLNEYYSYLLGGMNPGLLARLLSLVDFSLTETDLKEIFPALAPEIPIWLGQLTPVLSALTSLAGYRIYHDSFRQYVIDQCRILNISDQGALAPLVAWLKTRGFFKDVRAYNHLIKLLDETGHQEEALGLISTTFVADSLTWFHPEDSIRANLALGAAIAAREQDWSCLVRLSELHRVIHSAFGEHLQDIEVYGETFASIHGYESLCERLLFEGRPSFNPVIGLSLCSLIDDAGVIPPWREYFEASTSRDEEQCALAAFHGFCRTNGSEQHVLNSVLNFLLEGNPSKRYLRGLLHRTSKNFGREALEWLAGKLPATNQLLMFELCFSIARTYSPKTNQRTFYLNAALYFSKNVGQARQAIVAGATGLDWAKVRNIGDLVKQINDPNHELEPDFVDEWSDSVSILARRNPQTLKRNRKHIRADGWYRAWLRYLMDLSLATELAKTDPSQAETAVLQALDTLSQFDDPEAGPVRSVHLFPIRLKIRSSLTATLHLLHSDASFETFFDRVQSMMVNLTGWAFSVPWGPFAVNDIVDCFVNLARKRKLSRPVLDRAAGILTEGERQGYFFQVQSDVNLKFAIANAASGEMANAMEYWGSACERLCGYGERKDRTIFEIVDGFPLCDAATGISLIDQLRPLVDKVYHFTDGKGTRHAMMSLFEQLCVLSISAAALLLTETIVTQGYGGWQLKSCLQHLLMQSSSEVHPLLGYHVLQCVDHAHGLDDVRRSLVLLGRLASIDESLVPAAFHRVIEWPSSLHFGEEDTMYKELIQFATQHGIAVPDKLNKTDGLLTGEYLGSPRGTDPVFSVDATVTDMIRSLREFSARKYDERPDEVKLTNAILFKGVELISDGDSDAALRLITFFRDHYYLSNKGAVIDGLANGFLRYGYEKLAAALFVDAYMFSRGGGGWLSVGDEEHFHLIDRAVLIERETALFELFERVRDVLSGDGYISGLTQYLIVLSQKFDGAQKALECWHEAFKVIESRLPTSASVPCLFEGAIEIRSDWCIDELFIGLLLTIDDASFDAVHFIFQSLPAQSIRPLLRFYPSLSAPLKLKTLRTLERTIPFPREVAESIRNDLEQTAGSGWTLAELSQRILSLLDH